MKLSPQAVTFLSLLTVPFASASETAYLCKVRGTYEVEGTEESVVQPSRMAEHWAISRLMKAYNTVHDADYEMLSASMDSFKIQEKTKAEDTHVRRKLQKRLKYLASLQGSTATGCNLCANVDDDALFEGAEGEEGSSISAADLLRLDGTPTHEEWEAEWCRDLQYSPYSAFETVANCKITLFDCIDDMESPTGSTEASPSTFMSELASEVAAHLMGK